MTHEILDVLESVEKNDVRILGDCHCIFDCYVNSRLYLSISKFSKVLGISRYRPRFVSKTTKLLF